MAKLEGAMAALNRAIDLEDIRAGMPRVSQIDMNRALAKQTKLREDKPGIEAPPQLSEFEQLKAEADAAKKKTDEQLAKMQANVEICENCAFADDDNGWGGENLNDPAECKCPFSPKSNEYVDRTDTCDHFQKDDVGALRDEVLEDLAKDALEAAIGKPEYDPEWFATGRTHIECAGCAKERIMPAPCPGHVAGPTQCPDFEPRQDDETEDPTKVME